MTFIVERASNDLDIVVTGKDIHGLQKILGYSRQRPCEFEENHKLINIRKKGPAQLFLLNIYQYSLPVKTNNIPDNTSILVTSRERVNLNEEKRIDLEGLTENDSNKLFERLAVDEQLKEVSSQQQQGAKG